MSWYKDKKNDWKEIIETVSREEKRAALMIEKDTIQSMFLFKLNESELPFVFKGGTSLSKCYGAIDRFSEDVDLSMSKKLTESEKRKSSEIIINVGNAIDLKLDNDEDIKSRYDYNRYVFKYKSLFSDNLQEIIIETNYYITSYPVISHDVKSFVGNFCDKKCIKLPIDFEERDFKMSVQSLERTLIDKVFAVCDYYIQNMQDRDSRHLYDIAKLIERVELSEELIKRVRADRLNLKNNPSAQPRHNINDMLNRIIDSRFYESDYNSITKRLLYEEMSYEDAIEKGIGKIIKFEIF